VPWVEYDAKVQEGPEGLPEIALQTVKLKHVPWSRFLWEPGKDWGDVDWVARDHYLTRDEIREQFGQEPGGTGAGQQKRDDKRGGVKKYATCYRVTEVWYRPKRLIYVIGWDFEEPLEVRPDALNLQGFYPCPRPMFANVKSHELIPTPDHAFFAESYAYLNRLTNRIHSITTQIKAAGFYDAQLGDLAGIATADDGTFMAVRNLAERLGTAGGAAVFDRVIAELPLAQKVQVLQTLQQLLVAEKQRLDEQTGIADIVMGATAASETATAQSIKSNWANLRLARKTGEVSRAFRDVFRIMAEIMAEHFTPESLYLSSGMQVGPEVLAVVKTDIGRNLAIDIETDSTVALDDEAEKQQRIEFLNYVSPFLQTIIPAVQQGAFPADLAKNMVLFAVRSFKHGRALEESLETLPDAMAQMQQMQQQLQQAQQGMQQAQMQAQQFGQQAQQLQQQAAQSDQALQMERMKSASKQVDPMTAQLELRAKAADVAKAEAEAERARRELLVGGQKMDAEAASAAGIAEVVTTVQASVTQQSAATMQAIGAMQDAVAALSMQLAEKDAPKKETKVIKLTYGPNGKPSGAIVTETEG
jgi:hypothetical protein